MLSGFLSPQHDTSSGGGWTRRPPDMEGSCECTAEAVIKSQQGVVLQLGS